MPATTTPRIALQSGLELSQLVYGMWRLGDDKDRSASHVQAKVEACLAQGITSIDQADIYGNYESEQLFGAALKAAPQLRDQLEIITKCDIKLLTDKFPQRRVKYYDTSAAHIQSSVDASLSNMCTDRIDLLLIHRPDPLMDHHETGTALDALVASGKVRSVGVSNFKPHDWQLLQSAMSNKLQTNQLELSLLENSAFVNGDIEFLQQHGVPPMAWSPLAGGQLFTGDANLAEVTTVLQRIATEQSVGIDSVAIAWLLHHPVQVLPVLGTNNLDRIKKLSQACSVNMDRETWFELYVAANGHEVP